MEFKIEFLDADWRHICTMYINRENKRAAKDFAIDTAHLLGYSAYRINERNQEGN